MLLIDGGSLAQKGVDAGLLEKELERRGNSARAVRLALSAANHFERYELYRDLLDRLPKSAHPGQRWSLLAEACVVLVAWVPFRASSLEDTGVVFARSRSRAPTRASSPGPCRSLSSFYPLLAEHLFLQNPRLPALPWPRHPLVILAVLGACLGLTLPLLELDVRSFIYFQF